MIACSANPTAKQRLETEEAYLRSNMSFHMSFEKKTFITITGASQGIGKYTAIGFASKIPQSSVLLLLARNLTALDDVKQEIASQSPGMKVITKSFDQGELKQHIFDELFMDVFKDNGLSKDDFEQSVIVHNASISGDVKHQCCQLTDVKEVESTIDVCVSGMILLNSSFLHIFNENQKERFVINVSSGAAKIPMPTLSLYCLGKAARDMFFKVLAAEEPSIKVLNFAPGFVDTELLRYMKNNSALESTRDFFESQYRKGLVKQPEVAVNRLMEMLEKNTFVSGEHIDVMDYYND